MTPPAVLGRDPLPEPWVAGAGPMLWSLRVGEYRDRAVARQAVLDGAELARCRAFLRDTDRDRYRVAHVALRQLLGAYLDRDPADVRLTREPCPGCGEPHGRPAVAAGAPHFSHSRDAVLMAFADTPVGVDVEAMPDAGTAAEMGALFHPAERAELAALPYAARPAAVVRCWARKEAYLKGVGIGLGEDLSVTHVGAGSAPAAVPGWTLTDVPAQPGYAAACAIRTADSGTNRS